MTIRIANLTSLPFTGWVRCNTDGPLPAEERGFADRIGYAIGRVTGLGTHIIDVRLTLDPGQAVDYEPRSTVGDVIPPPTLPSNPVELFGGAAMIGGVPLQFVGLPDVDGAAITAHLRTRVGLMLVVDLFLRWYPGEAWAHGEAIVTASNPTVTDLHAFVPPDFMLRFGDALTFAIGRHFSQPLIDEGVPFADGQARAVPLVFVWPRLIRSAADFNSAMAATQHGISAIGIERLLADGNPVYPAGFSARAWTTPKIAAAAQRLHSWAAPLVGPNPESGNTGAQEDQVFVRGEALLPDGNGAEIVTYLSALKLANRPCHHREVNGGLLDYTGHTSPRLVLWDMRPHLPSVSPDRLGKLGGIAAWDVQGTWWGADVEHALYNTLAAGARYTGSPALQHELSAIARNYLFQWTIQAGLSTTQPFSARAQGWEGILAVHLWRDLEDRALAQRVADRWRARFDSFAAVLPNFDIRTDDPRLGPGQRWMPWQESVKCYGLDLAGAQLDRPQAREIALAHAKRILADAYVQQGETWTTRDVVALDGAAVTIGFFDLFGMPLAPATVLRHEPQHEQARAIWTQLLQRATQPKHTAWLAPGVPQ